MPKFWGYKKNQNYSIGCTGQTVYLYDNAGNILAKFKDLKYGYTPQFCPDKDIFIVKSTTGLLAVYSLENRSLIKKFRFSKFDASQDDGFCFSNDGNLFFNIERHIDSLHTRISIYDTESFTLQTQLFKEIDSPVFTHIEHDAKTSSYFVMGFYRSTSLSSNEANKYFVAELRNDNELTNIRELSDETFDYIRGYKSLEQFGFTDKSKEWSSLKYRGYDLTDIESKQIYLSTIDFAKEISYLL